MRKAFLESIMMHGILISLFIFSTMTGMQQSIGDIPVVSLSVGSLGVGGAKKQQAVTAPPVHKEVIAEPVKKEIKKYEQITSAKTAPVAPTVKKEEEKKQVSEQIATPAVAEQTSMIAQAVEEGTVGEQTQTGNSNSTPGSGEETGGGGHPNGSPRGGNEAYGMREVDSRPRVLHCQKPKYPRYAHDNGIHGEVLLSFVVDTNGRAERVKVIRSRPGDVFDRAAVDAVREWRFSPAMKNGNRVKVVAFQEIKFSLDDKN